MGRMGFIPILPIDITFVTVTATELLGVNTDRDHYGWEIRKMLFLDRVLYCFITSRKEVGAI